jgi:signal transduction histidine kinase
MRFLQQVSIKRKLMAIIMLTSSVSLLLACAAFVTYELYQLHSKLVRDTRTLARIIADYSDAVLIYNNPKEAEKILRTLQANPRIVSAILLTPGGQVFAAYHRAGDPRSDAPSRPWDEGHRIRDQHLEVFRPVRSEGELIGIVYLRSDLVEMYDRLKQYPGMVAVVMLIASAVALLLSSVLQRLISQPVLHLAEISRMVSGAKNYSVRAVKESQDELGELIEAFNEMLGEIQKRDAALQGARDDLEKRVEERTRELQEEIAERKQAEEKLKMIAAKLEQSNRELQDFAYVASHDLQEPLRKVQAFGDRLRAKCEPALTDEGRDYLDRMQNAARRMQNLIQDLLLFSRVTTQPHPFEKVPLAKVIREVLSDLEVRLQQTGGFVHMEALPTLDADPVQMRQLFQNLISNALKFHRPGVPPVVKISSHILEPPAGAESNGAQRCQIRVEDNGIGFDEKYRDRIFAVFQRLHSRQNYEGTGIGLAICRKITERHGGTITAHSLPGQGATFVVTLPMHQAKENS